MTISPNVLLVGAAALAIFVMAAALGLAWSVGRRQAEAGIAVPDGDGAARAYGLPGTADPGPSTSGADGVFAPDDATIDRVVRVVSLLFIAAVGGVVALSTGAGWQEVPVYLLLALATLFVVFMGDLLPDRLEGRRRYAAEAVGAIIFLALLVMLTNGIDSPFFVGYFLLVGGAALAWDGFGPIALALASALTYAFVSIVLLLNDTLGVANVTSADLAWIAFNMAALLLLAYVGTVAGRSQRRARDAALRLSRYDALTGLYNRGAFFTAVGREIKRVDRTGRGFCLVMLDLDDLKPVNDTFGHPAGDQLLRSITEVVLRTVRATDLAGRYGGDEFVVLLPETDAEGAFVVAEKLRRDISTLSVRVQDRAVRTSVSLGMVAFPDDGKTIEELLSAVDAAMYEAKRRGKNQIVGYTTRTERVATAIGPERPSGLPRQRPTRPDESRSAEIGLSRPSVREESDQPIGSPPYDLFDIPPRPRATEEDLLDATAPAYPVPHPHETAPVPGAAVVAPEVAPATTAVPQTPAAAPVTPVASPPQSGQPVTASPAPVAPAPPPAPDPGLQASASAATPSSAVPARAPFPRLPSMPSLPAQAVRAEPASAAPPPPVRAATPIEPQDAAAAGMPPVPTAGAPWSPRPSTRGSNEPRGARKPADRQYVAFPTEDDTPR